MLTRAAKTFEHADTPDILFADLISVMRTMESKKIVPYGDWESPISAEHVISGSRELSSPRASVSHISSWPR